MNVKNKKRGMMRGKIVFIGILIILYGMFYFQHAIASSGLLLTDFEGTDILLVHPFDGFIYGYTDEDMGGSSTIDELEIRGEDAVLNLVTKRKQGAKNSHGFLKISGKVTTKYEWGFTGCGLYFHSDRKAIDLSQYKGIRFYTKGSERWFVIKIVIPADVDYGFHETSFLPGENWEAITILFNKFKQPSLVKKRVSLEMALQNCQGILWQTKGQPIENYELYLDNIELIKDDKKSE